MKLKQSVDFIAGHNYTVSFKFSGTVDNGKTIRYFHTASTGIKDDKAIGDRIGVTTGEQLYSFSWTQTITETIETELQMGQCSGTITLTDAKLIDNGVLSVDENKLESMEFYPNPVNNGLLNISTSVMIDKLQVFDLAGKMVHQELNLETKKQIDLRKLSKGLYLVHITKNQAKDVRKIIVE